MPYAIRNQIQTPDYREDGVYKFVSYFTASGAPACVHLTREEVERRCEELLGPGRLEDDGESLSWVYLIG